MAVETGHYFNINDTLTIELNVIQYIVSVDSFIYSATNETATRYFDFYFRYKINSNDFTGVVWQTLNNTNLNAIPITPYDLLYLQIKIIRVGTDTTGDLILNTLLINSTYEDQSDTFYPLIFSNENQIFGYIKITDNDLLLYCNNIFNKAWKSIIPKFIERTEHLQWYLETVCTYLSLFYVHAKKMNDYYNDDSLLIDFLKQKGLYFSGNETLEDLQLICRNLFVEYRKRGTTQNIDEIKRLINFDSTNEFFFEELTKIESGWYLNKTSVNYDDLSFIQSLNKMVEKDGNVTDLDNYFITNTLSVGVIPDVDNDGNDISVMLITCAKECGIQCTSFDATDSRIMVVNPNFDYEISFRIKQLIPAKQYYFGVNCFDEDGNFLDSVNMVTGADTTEFLKKDNLYDIFPTNEYIKIRQILFNSSESLRTAQYATLNIGSGEYLRFNPLTKYIYPIITTYNAVTATCNVRIYDIKVCINSTIPIASFLQTCRIVHTLLQNNSTNYTESEITTIIDKYMIPANSIFIPEFYSI